MSVCCSLTQNLQFSSIHSYLSAVRHLQISAARVHSLDLITYVLRGVRHNPIHLKYTETAD